ncbi:ubiquitin-like protein 3 [Anomaloglossus baeobatrachus]|uniref:ubiquitin-like protein 3 n=1 Tax=Anomaloglossus baeobatrachus TaxID=238106 RepID=UPI003F50D385
MVVLAGRPSSEKFEKTWEYFALQKVAPCGVLMGISGFQKRYVSTIKSVRTQFIHRFPGGIIEELHREEMLQNCGDWEEEQVSSPCILRLIYQGRFLHGNVTLGALKLPLGKTTVMHLVARETLPEPNSQGQRNREKTGESNCCVIL